MESVGVNINGETNVPREEADIIAALNPWRDLNGTRHFMPRNDGQRDGRRLLIKRDLLTSVPYMIGKNACESRLVLTGNRNRFVFYQSMNPPEFPIQGIFYLEDISSFVNRRDGIYIFHLDDLQKKNNHHLLPRIGYRGDRQSLPNNMRGNLERFNHYIKN